MQRQPLNAAWSNRLRRIWLPSIAAAGLLVPMARAASPQWPPPEGAACRPTEQGRADAKLLTRLAKEGESTSDFAKAAFYYRQAYSLNCTEHTLLRNLARAYEGNGELPAALESWSLYLERAKPNDSLKLDAKIAIAKLVARGASLGPSSSSPHADQARRSARPAPRPSSMEARTTQPIDPWARPATVSSSPVQPFESFWVDPANPTAGMFADPWADLGRPTAASGSARLPVNARAIHPATSASVGLR